MLWMVFYWLFMLLLVCQLCFDRYATWLESWMFLCFSYSLNLDFVYVIFLVSMLWAQGLMLFFFWISLFFIPLSCCWNLESFDNSWFELQIKKFKDALAKHTPDRCSLGPAKGLEEKELLALAACKELNFTYTPKPAQEFSVKASKSNHPSPQQELPAVAEAEGDAVKLSQNRTLTTAGRWCGCCVSHSPDS